MPPHYWDLTEATPVAHEEKVLWAAQLGSRATRRTTADIRGMTTLGVM
jgi:hypothetical protein